MTSIYRLWAYICTKYERYSIQSIVYYPKELLSDLFYSKMNNILLHKYKRLFFRSKLIFCSDTDRWYTKTSVQYCIYEIYRLENADSRGNKKIRIRELLNKFPAPLQFVVCSEAFQEECQIAAESHGLVADRLPAPVPLEVFDHSLVEIDVGKRCI